MHVFSDTCHRKEMFLILKATVRKSADKNECYVIQKKYTVYKGQYGLWETKDDSLVFIPKGSAVYDFCRTFHGKLWCKTQFSGRQSGTKFLRYTECVIGNNPVKLSCSH